MPKATSNDKVVKFVPTPELICVLESGADAFTFDNTWPDGARKVGHHREEVLYLRAQKKSRPCDQWHPFEEEVWAHARALELLHGKKKQFYGEARVLAHEGRRPWLSNESARGFHDSDPEDDRFALEATDVDEAALESYSWKELVTSDKDDACMMVFSGERRPTSILRDQALVLLTPRWDDYCHKGLVPGKPGAAAPTLAKKRGRRRW